MVFETSCWATGGIGPQCDDNSIVQRRPKIDYFDVNSIKTTPAITSPISHISSNGYYGYCPTTNLNTNCDSEMNENIVSMGNSTDDFPMHEAAAESMCSEQPTSTTTHVQSYQGQSIDKRKRTNDQCNVLETKRSRNCFSDCIEDVRMHTGDRVNEMDDMLDLSKTAVNKSNQNKYFKSTMMMSHII